jgi:hypothetical protein
MIEVSVRPCGDSNTVGLRGDAGAVATNAGSVGKLDATPVSWSIRAISYV